MNPLSHTSESNLGDPHTDESAHYLLKLFIVINFFIKYKFY